MDGNDNGYAMVMVMRMVLRMAMTTIMTMTMMRVTMIFALSMIAIEVAQISQLVTVMTMTAAKPATNGELNAKSKGHNAIMCKVWHTRRKVAGSGTVSCVCKGVVRIRKSPVAVGVGAVATTGSRSDDSNDTWQRSTDGSSE